MAAPGPGDEDGDEQGAAIHIVVFDSPCPGVKASIVAT